ncbi:hypothetical protein BSPLISOX_1741, partial [uncultured Gammaproteobacteria bacterium]
YEIKSGHKRLSLGLEYQRSNFSTHINSYYPMSHRRNIGDYTEEALAGYDLKLIGQVPYLPWAKIKGTRYHWDGKQGPDVKGTIFGVAVELTSSIGVEFGTEKSNTADKASYMRLTTQLPFKDNESFTNFSIDSKPFRNTGIVNLTDLSPVERSNKIRIEKVSRTSAVVLGVYNATTKDARCTLYNASGVAVARGSGTTTTDGSVSFPRVILSTTSSLYYSICKGGSYTDEATDKTVDAPTLHSAAMYSGTGNLVLIASPLSEIAYQMADNATGSLSDFAKVIEEKNDNVATAFGLDNIDVITTFPTDLTKTAAQNDNAGRFGLILSAISQMGEDLETSPGATIEALVRDINGTDGSHPNTIEGRKHKSGSETVDLLVAIDNFEKGNARGKNNTGEAGSAKGEDSVRGKLAIVKISLYDGNNNMPTVKDYTAYADVTGVNNLVEVSLKIAAATQADSDTRSEIQTLVNDAPGLAAAKKSTLEASSYSVNTDGTTTSTITMQAKDATTNSKNLTTGGLTVTMSVNGSATLSSVSDNADGTYTATITNNTVETV